MKNDIKTEIPVTIIGGLIFLVVYYLMTNDFQNALLIAVVYFVVSILIRLLANYFYKKVRIY